MKVLSLFDGISVARVALERAGIPVEVYYASEIDKYAMQISAKNYPDIVQLGSVTDLHFPYEKNEDLIGYDIDLLIGGSPCQDLSIAKGKREGLSGKRSGLFFEYLRILNEVQPKYFLLENVASMSDENRDTISNALSTEPIMIDSALVSAQQRRRYFWTNIPVKQPTDRGLIINDIIDDVERKWIEPKNPVKTKRGIKWDTSGKGWYSQQDRGYDVMGKFPTIPTARTITKANVLFRDGKVGVLTWSELEKLQGLPVGYTDIGDGNRIEKRGGVIGNAFNAEVVAHILSFIKNEKTPNI